MKLDKLINDIFVGKEMGTPTEATEAAVTKGLRDIPYNQGLVLSRMYLHDMSTKEVAEEMGCTESYVRTLRRGGLCRLRHPKHSAPIFRTLAE